MNNPATTDDAAPPAPKRRDSNAPEDKAYASRNALKHGLRARAFVLLPGEDSALSRGRERAG